MTEKQSWVIRRNEKREEESKKTRKNWEMVWGRRRQAGERKDRKE